MLTESQLQALEKVKEEKKAHGEIETHHPGYLGSHDTYYVGTINNIGKIYAQTLIETYCKVDFVKLYERKNAIVAADLLNNRVLPFYKGNGLKFHFYYFEADKLTLGANLKE